MRRFLPVFALFIPFVGGIVLFNEVAEDIGDRLNLGRGADFLKVLAFCAIPFQIKYSFDFWHWLLRVSG